MRISPFLAEATLALGAPLALGAVTAPTNEAIPTTWVEVQKLAAPDAQAGQFFGAAVAMGDDLVAIGTGPGLESAEKVYLFRRTLQGRWELAAELARAPEQAVSFGASLALSGERLVVGAPAPAQNEGGGRALVFDPAPPDGWSLTAELPGTATVSPYAFGVPVAISRDGGTVAVGARGHVFVFSEDTTGAFGQPADLPFGDDILPTSLLLDGDTLLAGASDPGEIFVFERGPGGTWSQQARFGQPRRRSDLFGSTIAANQQILAVGAPREDNPGIDRGFVHLFARPSGPASWVEIARLTAPGLSETPFFGNAVDIAGDTMAVGMPYDESEGAVHLYDLGAADVGDRWTRLLASDAGDDGIGNNFGSALDLDQVALVVGAPWDDDGCGGELGCYSGAAYVFERGPGPPLPDFLWEPLDPNDGEEVQFLDLTVGEATSYAWDFGDGGVSHEPRPVHIYAAPDLYVVSLTVANELGMRTARRTLEVISSSIRRCRPGPTALCLHDGRFEVAVGWRDFDGNTGAGHVVPAASIDSGLFYFFTPENWEVLIKVLDGCPINGRYWVFFAATTNVELTVTVRDSATDRVNTYTNPLGQASDAVTDTSAFSTCP